MSLATDILKYSGSLIPSRKIERREPLSYPQRKTKPPVPKKKVKPVTDIPGVSWDVSNNSWRAYFYDGDKAHRLGNFSNAERAGLAVRLYKFWRKRGYHTTEHRKPSIRLYIRCSDKS